MHTIRLVVLLGGCLALGSLLHCAGQDDTPVLIPDVPGFAKDGEPRQYLAETLFEYINGAAEGYLSFGFEELTTQHYRGVGEQTLTVELYRHGSRNNGFGIYREERPAEGPFLDIGAQGYYEPGVLNFFKGPHYVKLTGFQLGDRDESILTSVARQIAGTLEGDADLPPVLACFPREGLIPGTARYTASHFLGHAFLHSAFDADYRAETGVGRMFIIETTGEQEAERMRADYLGLVRQRGGEVSREDGIDRFEDPYHRSLGQVTLKRIGRYLCGVLGDRPERAGPSLGQMDACLQSL